VPANRAEQFTLVQMRNIVGRISGNAKQIAVAEQLCTTHRE